MMLMYRLSRAMDIHKVKFHLHFHGYLNAFPWGNQSQDGAGGASTSHRILNDAEKMVVGSQAYGYLIQCQQLGLLNNIDVETIIERIMMAGFAVCRFTGDEILRCGISI